MKLKLSEIKISQEFQNTNPSPVKLEICRSYYRENGCLDREIIVNQERVLTDGYIGYLVLKENGVEAAEVTVLNERAAYRRKETTYVFARHPKNEKEYVWRVTPGTMNANLIAPGRRVVVAKSDGNCVVTVSRVETLELPPVSTKVRRVLRCMID